MNNKEYEELSGQINEVSVAVDEVRESMRKLLKRMDDIEKQVNEYRREADQVLVQFDKLIPYLADLKNAMNTLAAVGGRNAPF